MLQVQINNPEASHFVFSGQSPVETFEHEGISLFYWGDIQNTKEITRLLANESTIQLISPNPVQCLYHAYRHWGMGFANHIQGACGFVLYDSHKDMLLMGRDKLGLCQTYYTFIDGICHFAPDLLSLCHKRTTNRLNEKFIQQYLSCGFTPPPHTLVEGIYKVPAASWVQIKAEKDIKTHTYWYPVNNSYAISKEDVPSFEAAVQAVKNKLGDDTPQHTDITPKTLFNALETRDMANPMADLADFITPMQNTTLLFSPRKPVSFWQKWFKKEEFIPATIAESTTSDLISPFIRRNQQTIEQSLKVLREDFDSQPEQKKNPSNWIRNIYLSLILPEKISAFGGDNPLLKADLIELIIGLPEKISLQIPEALESLKKPASQPLETWFFERYKNESWQLVERFARETEILNLGATEEAWQEGDLKLNWRLTSLALWWQVAVKGEDPFI